MVLYSCEICLKEFKKKDDFIKHTQRRKTPCQPINETPKITPVIQQNPPIINNLEENNENNGNICVYCNTIFTRSDALKRHLDNRCKVKKIKEDEEKNDKENIFKLLLAKEEENKK
jgi:hypothetical protein